MHSKYIYTCMYTIYIYIETSCLAGLIIREKFINCDVLIHHRVIITWLNVT